MTNRNRLPHHRFDLRRLHGDCRLGIEAGADWRAGRESKSEFNESLALDQPDTHTLGSTILFTARDYGTPMTFTPPPWARKVTKEMLRFRSINSWEYGYWWVEWGGDLDTIRDNEKIRHELLAISLGVWDYIKNSGAHPSSANWALDWLGMMPGKRGSRRLVGDHVLREDDLMGKTGEFADAVCIGGWSMDDHPPSGFDRPDLRPARQVPPPFPYNIPLRSLYSRNVANLMMAGRNISATHVAFTSTRVMATCAVIGQAMGTAAALCVRHGITPRQLATDQERVLALQQTLLRDDQTIRTWRTVIRRTWHAMLRSALPGRLPRPTQHMSSMGGFAISRVNGITVGRLKCALTECSWTCAGRSQSRYARCKSRSTAAFIAN